MSLINTMISNMTSYLYVPPMTVTESITVDKTGDSLTWENGGQVYYSNNVSITGGTSRCTIINGLYAGGLTVTSPGAICLTGIMIPEDSTLTLSTSQSILITDSTILGSIQCVGGNPGILVDLMTISKSSLKNIPLLSPITQSSSFSSVSLSQTILLPSCPVDKTFLYGFYMPAETVPCIVCQWDKTEWTISSYDTTLLNNCALTDAHTLTLTWVKNGATQLNHHFL